MSSEPSKLDEGKRELGKLIKFPKIAIPRRNNDELEFLPAALELIETPASPLGRVMMWTIIALAAIAFLWACIGKVDIIATAPGRVIPSGQIKLIQPFEIGVVKAIHVTDGDRVHAGDVLVELDPTSNQADQERVERDRVQAQLDVARLSAALAANADSFTAPQDADPALVNAARRQLVAMLSQQQAKVDGIVNQITAKQAERDQAKATIVKVQASLPIVEKRVDIYNKLAANQYSSKVAALEAEQQLVEARDDRAVAQHQLEGAEASIAALQQQKQGAEAEFRAQTLDDLAKARQKLAELDQDRIKATQRTDLQTLKAPVDGTVEQLAVHTVGGVVTPAQTMMVVVPEGSKLQIEAMLPNRDVGFVHVGQPAEVKVEAFTYTRYGLIHGTVEGISRDAVQSGGGRKSQEGGRQDNSQDASASADGPREESSYVARVSLSQTAIDTEDGPRPLEPGMAVTAEIKTGQRRVIQYLLSPLLRYKHEGLKER
jgi:hemolysin D